MHKTERIYLIGYENDATNTKSNNQLLGKQY